MKVLDLLCPQAHRFEGWFASEGDFQQQLERGLVQCPMCGNAEVHKALTAPRLNLRHGVGSDNTATKAGSAAGDKVHPPALPLADDTVGGPGQPADHRRERGSNQAALHTSAPSDSDRQAAWLALARRVVAETEDVGTRFAQEARRMHFGETQERAIRGQASPEEAVALLEDGIPVLPLLLPDAAKETLQ